MAKRRPAASPPKKERRKSPQRHTSRRPISRRQISRRQIGLVLLVLVIVAGLLFGRSSYSAWLVQRARMRMQSGAISQALGLLQRAARISPQDGDIDLRLAYCYRYLHQVVRWQEAVDSGRAKGIAPAKLERERKLYDIQTGNWPPNSESDLATLSDGAVTEYDVPTTFIAGCLASNRLAMAKRILDAWSSGNSPDNPHTAFAAGLYWRAIGNHELAEKELERTLRLAPKHELARVALAELLEKDNQLCAALDHFLALGRISPTCDEAIVGASRVLRKLGYTQQASKVLQPIAQQNSTATVEAELGRIAMDQGDYKAAEKAFAAADVQQSWDPFMLISAVRLYGMMGNATKAEQLFQRVAAVGNSMTRAGDLQIRLKVDPTDQQAAAEMTELQRELSAQMNAPLTAFTAALDALPEPRRLYMLHCADCHGEQGGGDGRSARHLFPYPRDLRHERSRLVSTRNGIPTLKDTIAVLRRGIPGTSMAAFDELSDQQLQMLAEETHRLRKLGLREQYLAELALFDEPVDEADVEQYVRRMSTPGEVIEVPQMKPPAATSIARGKEIFIQQACHTCHGEDGTGLANQVWYDERGFPVRTRDLAHEELKGSHDARAVYLRIAAGMPGTPHPANTTLNKQQLTDVVQYCLSLAREPKQHLTDFERAALATGSDYVSAQAVGHED